MAWLRVHHALLYVLAHRNAPRRHFVLAVEARAPGLCVLPLDDRRHDVVGRGVVNLGAAEAELHRPVSTFAPPFARRAMSELVAHTCFLYPSPPLLEACFFERALAPDLRALATFIGGGHSWRKAPLMMTITRAAAHLLSTSKATARRLSSAVRDAQAASVGVTQRTARCLANAVWHFDAARDDLALARHPEMSNDDVKVVAEGVSSIDVAFSLRGRTPGPGAELRVQLKNEELRNKGRTDVGALAACDVEGDLRPQPRSRNIPAAASSSSNASQTASPSSKKASPCATAWAPTPTRPRRWSSPPSSR